MEACEGKVLVARKLYNGEGAWMGWQGGIRERKAFHS
jgi:hypothetical protein